MTLSSRGDLSSTAHAMMDVLPSFVSFHGQKMTIVSLQGIYDGRT